MKQIVKKVLSPQWFAIGYLPWLAVNMATPVNVLDFTRVVLVLFAVWALAICVKEFFFSGKQAWTDKGIAVLLFFLAACLLSQVLLFRYGGLDVIGKLCYFSLCILLLYPQRALQSADYIRLIGVVARVLGVAIGALMLISDWMFIDLFSATITVRAGVVAHVGFAENRLFGVFTSPNVGGICALILLWCSFVTILWSRQMRCKVLWRVLAGVQIALAAIYISLALSRGTYISGLVLVIGYLILRPAFAREKALNVFVQIAIRAASIAAAVALCVGTLNVVNRLCCEAITWNYETKVKHQMIEDTEEMKEIIESVKLGSEGRVEANREDIDFTNKRSHIWNSHLSLLKGKHLFIGLNQPDEYLSQMMAQGKTYSNTVVTYVKYGSGNLHNGYLQVLVNGGLLAFLPLVLFLGWCAFLAARYAGRTLFSGKLPLDTAAYTLFSLTLPMVMAILINNVVESNFALMGANFIQAFFWFVTGACVLSMREGAKR